MHECTLGGVRVGATPQGMLTFSQVTAPVKAFAVFWAQFSCTNDECLQQQQQQQKRRNTD
jgi:hypothetical protein